MKTPTWGTVIGIIMIVFGGCSVMNDIKSITLPAMLEKQKVIFKDEMEKSKTTEQDSVSTKNTDSLSTVTDENDSEDFFIGGEKSIEKMLDLSGFTKTWIVRFGYIGLLVSALYIIGGIFLLVRRNFSIKLVYAALVISILCSGAQAAVLTSSSSSGIIALTTGLSQIFGIIIDIILLAVVFASDKEAYATIEK